MTKITNKKRENKIKEKYTKKIKISHNLHTMQTMLQFNSLINFHMTAIMTG